MLIFSQGSHQDGYLRAAVTQRPPFDYTNPEVRPQITVTLFWMEIIVFYRCALCHKPALPLNGLAASSKLKWECREFSLHNYASPGPFQSNPMVLWIWSSFWSYFYWKSYGQWRTDCDRRGAGGWRRRYLFWLYQQHPGDLRRKWWAVILNHFKICYRSGNRLQCQHGPYAMQRSPSFRFSSSCILCPTKSSSRWSTSSRSSGSGTRFPAVLLLCKNDHY